MFVCVSIGIEGMPTPPTLSRRTITLYRQSYSRTILFFYTSFLSCGTGQVLEEEMPGGKMKVEIRNRVGEGPLNDGCGAEWVQKVRSSLPKGIALDNVQIHFIRVISC